MSEDPGTEEAPATGGEEPTPADGDAVSEDDLPPGATDEIHPATAVKLLLFLVWWFSGIGVGTAFMEPAIIGSAISAELFLVVILAHFCSVLLIVALIPGREDSFQRERDDG